MNLNKNGKIARFYQWFYGRDYLPNNLCRLFWLLVATLPLFFLRIPAYILRVFGLNIKTTDLTPTGVLIYIALILLLLLGTAMYLSPLLAIIVVGLPIVVYLGARFLDSDTLHDVVDITIGTVRGVKNRYCPHINWTDGK